MAAPLGSQYILTFSALFSVFLSSQALEALDAANAANSNSSLFSFSFQRFGKNFTSDHEIALRGDAGIIDSGVRLASRGRIMYRKPIRFLGTNPGFSTNFSFFVSPGSGDGVGLAFSLSPSSGPLESSILSVKYVASRGGGNFIEVHFGGGISIRSSDLSSINLALNRGDKLHSWIDYDGESKILEVRLSSVRDRRPANASISYPVDLSGVLWRETMLVAISSSNRNSTQPTRIYSWSFAVKHGVPYLMHSNPLDPSSFLVKHTEGPPIHLSRVYPWRILVALVFGTVCGLLVAFAVLLMLSAMFERRPVAPVEYPDSPVEFGDEKIVLVGEKGAGDKAK